MQSGQHPLCSDRFSALSTSSRALLRLGLSNCGRGAAGVGRAVFRAIAPGSIISNPTRRPVLPSRAQRSHTHSRDSGSCRFGDSLQCSGIGQHRLTADRHSSQDLRLQQRLRRGACTSRVRVPRRNSGLMRRAVQLRPLRQPRSVVSSTSSSSPLSAIDPRPIPAADGRSALRDCASNKGFNLTFHGTLRIDSIVCSGELSCSDSAAPAKKGLPKRSPFPVSPNRSDGVA